MSRYKPSRYYPPEPEAFILVRMSSHLKPKDVAAMLHVTEKTINNWESGKTTIPYAAFKLLKVLAHYELPDEKWQGWCVRRGSLWSPSNRRFEAHELTYISNMFQMARTWIKEREKAQEAARAAAQLRRPILKLILGGKQ